MERKCAKRRESNRKEKKVYETISKASKCGKNRNNIDKVEQNNEKVKEMMQNMKSIYQGLR
jgi:hypothetical protein